MASNQKSQTYDNALLLKDAGAVTASAAAQVSAAAKIITLGAARTDFRVVVDVSATKTSANDESYRIRVQGSTSSSFASGVVTFASLELGDSTVTGNTADVPTGRFEVGLSNEYNGTTYPYLRVYHLIAGTSPSINYTAYAVVDN